ncbi:MAG: DNA-processing protein DprA [Candidatus Poribacteria bacterium]|nr:DNA-processing protein DprA [Candidatus Poribacteria bacterium]
MVSAVDMSYSTETDQEKHREYLFALASVEGIGAVRLKRLLTRFGSADRIFDAELVEIAQLPHFNPILASRILTVRNRFAELRRKLEALNNQGIEVIFPKDAEYPALLRSVPDAPTVLCRIGELSEMNEQCVAIVGSNRPTVDSINVTLGLSIRLVEAGFTIVSGLASGIDTNAHYGALGVNGTTIGVVSTDLSSIYPPENRELAMKICETGYVFSEHPFPASPTPANLVLRNRIISGLSKATVVVETSKEGGAMHTARYAQLQDRPVFACQWNSYNQHNEGTRQLIRSGALPFLSDQLDTVVDILTHPDRLQNHIIGTSIEQMTLFEH